MASRDPAALEQLLKEEYFKIIELTERFDQKAIAMKGWSITLSTAAVTAGTIRDAPAVLLVAAAGSFFFWMIESFWKSFQSAHYDRLFDIEAYFRGERDSIDPIQAQSQWFRSWGDREDESGKLVRGKASTWGRRMWDLHIALPHIVIVAGSVVLFVVETN